MTSEPAKPEDFVRRIDRLRADLFEQGRRVGTMLERSVEALFERGVVVVATSNRHPDDLYEDGLNRQVFLPFIAMLKERLDLHHLEGG